MSTVQPKEQPINKDTMDRYKEVVMVAPVEWQANYSNILPSDMQQMCVDLISQIEVLRGNRDQASGYVPEAGTPEVESEKEASKKDRERDPKDTGYNNPGHTGGAASAADSAGKSKK